MRRPLEDEDARELDRDWNLYNHGCHLCERCGRQLHMGAWWVGNDLVCEACSRRSHCEDPIPVILGGQGRDGDDLAGDALGAATIGAVCMVLLGIAGLIWLLVT